MHIPEFSTSIFECDDASSLKLACGNRFIRKLPDDRPLGYLHKLFGPLDVIRIKSMRDSIGRRLPEEFESFLSWSNGASLFDNHLQIYGLVENFSRSIEPERQQPISIIDRNRIFSKIENAQWENGWTRIGAVVGWDSIYEIDLHNDGNCVISSTSERLFTQTFGQCVSTIIGRINGCFSRDGIIDRSYAEIEAALSSLFRLQ